MCLALKIYFTIESVDYFNESAHNFQLLWNIGEIFLFLSPFNIVSQFDKFKHGAKHTNMCCLLKYSTLFTQHTIKIVFHNLNNVQIKWFSLKIYWMISIIYLKEEKYQAKMVGPNEADR